MLDFRPGAGGVGVDQQADAARQRARNGDLGGMEQGHNVPAKLLRRPGGERRVEVPGDGEQGADDVVGLQPIGLDQRAKQLVGCGENFIGIIVVDGSGSPNAMEAD